MREKKKAVLLLVTVLILGLAACGKGPQPAAVDTSAGDLIQTGPGEVLPEASEEACEITVWCGKDLVELTRCQIEALEAENVGGVKLRATIQGMEEGELTQRMLQAGASGGDLFFFSSDRLPQLVRAGALDKLGQEAADLVGRTCDAAAVTAATCKGEVYAYPISMDDSYLMYYDNTVVRDPGDLDAIVEDCQQADKKICFALDNGWYLASFFLGAGCVSDWTMDETGGWTANDSFNSDAGLIAMKGVRQLMDSPAFVAESSTAAFRNGAAAVISGSWDYVTAKQILGQKLGVAALPNYTVDDTGYGLGAFARCRMIGVKPQDDRERTEILHELARHLADADAQVKRYEVLGWGPTDLEVRSSARIQSDPIQAALSAQAERSTIQTVPEDWWPIAQTLFSAAEKSDGTADLKAALQAYQEAVVLLENLKPGLLFVGAWNDWNNAAVDGSYMLSGEGDLQSLVIEIPQAEDMSGRIVNNGKWENDKGYAQITLGKELALDLGADNSDNNIVFAEPGTYRISINTASNAIMLEKLDPPDTEETEAPAAP